MIGGKKMKIKRTTPSSVKAEIVKKLLRQEINPELTTKQILVILNHLQNHHRGLRTRLRLDDQKALELITKHNINPCTAYRWVRLSVIPEEVIGKMREYSKGATFNQSRLIEIDNARVRRKRAELSLMILEKGRQLMEDLERLHYGGR